MVYFTGDFIVKLFFQFGSCGMDEFSSSFLLSVFFLGLPSVKYSCYLSIREHYNLARIVCPHYPLCVFCDISWLADSYVEDAVRLISVL